MPQDVRDRIARRWLAAGAPRWERFTTTQTATGAERAGKRSGEQYRVEQLPDGRFAVWIVRRG